MNEAIGVEFISSPALLKIDVQGFEMEVLKGCHSMLDSFTWVYVECSFIELYEGQALANEVVDYLHKNGFKLTGVYNMSYDSNGIAIQADFLFNHGKTINHRIHGKSLC